MKVTVPTKLWIDGIPDPMCPNCGTALFAVVHIYFDGRATERSGKCPECNYEGKVK